MLETPQERVKLLKAGVDGKTIERIYLTHNNFKIIYSPILFESDKKQISSSTLLKTIKMIFSGRLKSLRLLMLIMFPLLYCIIRGTQKIIRNMTLSKRG